MSYVQCCNVRSEFSFSFIVKYDTVSEVIFADKRVTELAIYRSRRDKYMTEHPNCECNCGKPSQDLHHKNGRTGKMVYNVKYFMAVSRECHNRIHENPTLSRELGYLI